MIFHLRIVSQIFCSRVDVSPSCFADSTAPFIGYIFPNDKLFYGVLRDTYNLNDAANISWTSGYPTQSLTLQCNEGLQGTGPPWQQIWGLNSTDPSGNGSVIFYLGTIDPLPPAHNTCRFVLEVRDVQGDTVGTSATAYSPDISIDLRTGGDKGTTYLGYNAVPSGSLAASSSVTPTSSSTASDKASSSAVAANDASTTSSSSEDTAQRDAAASASTAGASNTNPLSSTATSLSSSSKGVDTRVATGIGIGVGVAMLAIASMVACKLVRHRRRTQGVRLGTGHGDKKLIELDSTTTAPKAEMFDISHFSELEHEYHETARRGSREVRNLAPGRVFEI